MSSSTRWRIGTTAVAGTVVAVAMVLLGMEPRLALVACITVAVGCTTWMLVDVGEAVSPVIWSDRGAPIDTSAATDRRVQILRQRLWRPPRERRLLAVGSADAGSRPDDVAEALLAVIEDVLAEHGIDPGSDPDAVEAIIGRDLARFVTDPSARRSMMHRRALPDTLARIEGLPSSPTSPSPERRIPSP